MNSKVLRLSVIVFAASAFMMLWVAFATAQVSFADSAQVPVYLHYGTDSGEEGSPVDKMVEEKDNDVKSDGGYSAVQTGDESEKGAFCLWVTVMALSATAIVLSLIKSFSFNSRKRRKGIGND